MPKDRPHESHDASQRPFTTDAADASLRRAQLSQREGLERDLQLAALRLAGELGYSALTVQRIIERAGSNRARFYTSFADKEDCYAQGYTLVIEELATALLAPGRSSTDWLGGFRSGLAALASFAEAEPALARGVLAEVHVAGGAAIDKRKEVFERLSRAIDRARRETVASRHSPPPITSAFILSAIEAAVIRSLLYDEGQAFAASIPDLTYMAAAMYFGTNAARAAYRQARRDL
jgi:AcrR family transcriptional regulator